MYDVDGNRMWDFHNGFGSMVQGHAHPAIVRGGARARRRSARTSPPTTEDGDRRRRGARSAASGLDRWRFVNSGSEATMDAIRIARGLHRPRDDREDLRLLPRPPRRRDGLDRRRVRPDRRPRELRLAALRRRHPEGGRRPDDPGARSTTPARWSGASSASSAEGRKPACVIMEAAMMNLGVVLPEPGYLEAVREITARHGDRADLRRGQDGPGDRRRRRDRALRRASPTWSRSPRRSAAGCPSGAIGGTEEVMSVVEDGTVYQVGTYNGNPLSMAAARASLERGADARRPTRTSTRSTTASSPAARA